MTDTTETTGTKEMYEALEKTLGAPTAAFLKAVNEDRRGKRLLAHSAFEHRHGSSCAAADYEEILLKYTGLRYGAHDLYAFKGRAVTSKEFNRLVNAVVHDPSLIVFKGEEALGAAFSLAMEHPTDVNRTAFLTLLEEE